MTNDVIITHFDNVMQTPCFLPAYRNYLRTMEDGHGMHVFGWTNRDPCFAAMIEDKCVGGIIYVIDQSLARIHINYSFVESEYRGRRIHGMMFSKLEERARQLKLVTISALVSVNNQPLLQASTRTGMIPTYYRTVKTL